MAGADGRHPRRGHPAVARRHQFRRHDPGRPALHQGLDAGVLSRCRDLEPVKGLMLYGMYATAYDPAIASIFSVTPASSIDLTSARIYETGVKSDLRRQARGVRPSPPMTSSRQNVYVQLTNAIATEAGEVHTRGVEISGAVRPIENVKLWGNVAFTEAHYGDFDVWTGNTPSNVAPVIINAGASYTLQQLALAGRDRRIDPPCRPALSVRGRPHRHAALHHGRSLRLHRHPRPGFVLARPRQDARRLPRPQPDQRDSTPSSPTPATPTRSISARRGRSSCRRRRSGDG